MLLGVLEGLLMVYPPPMFIRSDDAPALIAEVLSDMCDVSITTSIYYIEQGSL